MTRLPLFLGLWLASGLAMGAGVGKNAECRIPNAPMATASGAKGESGSPAAKGPDPAIENQKSKNENPPVPAPRPTSQTAGNQSGYLPYQEPGLPDSPGLLTVAGRVVGSLALVVGLIFVTAVGLRRFLGGKKTPVTSRKVTELVEVTPLGGKRYLYLIRVADRLLVVGSGGERLELLTEISDPLVVATVAAMPRQSQFFELLHRVRAKEAAPAGEQLPAQC